MLTIFTQKQENFSNPFKIIIIIIFFVLFMNSIIIFNMNNNEIQSMN